MRTCVTASTHQACVCVMVLGVCVSVSANTLSVRVCVCVNYGCVCERQHAHITIERLLWQLLPRRLQCYLVYGRRHLNTCPIFPQSPSHGIGPRISTGTTAAKWHLGRLFLQLLPLVSNKHLISLSNFSPGAGFQSHEWSGHESRARCTGPECLLTQVPRRSCAELGLTGLLGLVMIS